MHPRKTPTCVHKETYITVTTEGLFVRAENEKQPKYQARGKWISKHCLRKLSVTIKCSLPMLSNVVATSHRCLLNAQNVTKRD